MNAAKLKGKVIKKVHQIIHDGQAGRRWAVDAIEFTDGTFLRFVTLEGDGEYGTEGIYPAQGVEQ